MHAHAVTLTHHTLSPSSVHNACTHRVMHLNTPSHTPSLTLTHPSLTPSSPLTPSPTPHPPSHPLTHPHPLYTPLPSAPVHTEGGGAVDDSWRLLLEDLRAHSGDIAHDMKNPLNGVLALTQNVVAVSLFVLV